MTELQSRYLELRNDISLRLGALFAESNGKTLPWSDRKSPLKPMDFQCLSKPFKFLDHSDGTTRIAVGTTKSGLFIMCQTGADVYPVETIHLSTVQKLALIEQLESE